MEILHSMGLYEAIEKKGTKVWEYAIWSHNDTGLLERTGIGPDVTVQTPFPWTLSIEEGELRRILIEHLDRLACKVETGMELLNFQRESQQWPVVAFVKNHHSNVIETWRPQYMLGCDGAKSKVRELAGILMNLYGNVDFWGMGVLSVKSDFPDLRRRCALKSPDGACILTPGTGGSVVFVTDARAETTSEAERGRPADTQITHLHQHASSKGIIFAVQTRLRNILTPFNFEIGKVHWIDNFAWQKRLSQRFTDRWGHVFLLGDACHIHSPLSKQMVNGGMLDAFNLTWKLALVYHGLGPQALLTTYEFERKALLPKSLELDIQFDRIFISNSTDAATTAIGFDVLEKASGYTSGCGIRYASSQIVHDNVRAVLKKVPNVLTPGRRFPPLNLIRSTDGNRMSSLEAMPARCCFTIVVLAGELLQATILEGLANFLNSVSSPLFIYTHFASPKLSFVDLVVIHTSSHFDISFSALPQPFSRYLDNIYEDFEGNGHKMIGIPPKLGALCCVRPDGIVGMVTNPDNCYSISEYLKSSLTNAENFNDIAMENEEI